MLYDGLETHLEVFGTADPWHRWSIGRGECWGHRYHTDCYRGWWDDHTETSKSLQTALYKTNKLLQKKQKKTKTASSLAMALKRTDTLYHKKSQLSSHGTAHNAYGITQNTLFCVPTALHKTHTHTHYHIKTPSSLSTTLNKAYTLLHKYSQLSSHGTAQKTHIIT